MIARDPDPALEINRNPRLNGQGPDPDSYQGSHTGDKRMEQRCQMVGSPSLPQRVARGAEGISVH